MRSRISLGCLLCIVGVAVFLPANAFAITITLSQMSSEADEVPGTPASALDGVVSFDIGEFDGGNAGDEIKITVENTTSGGPGAGDYDISEIWLNLTSDISVTSILSPASGGNNDNIGFDLTTGATMVDGFGTFTLGLTVDMDVNLNASLIGPGTTSEIILAFSCSGTCDMGDLVDNGSGKAVAGKWINGGNAYGDPNDSAFGSSAVPEPGTALLLGVGLFGLAQHARRRNA